MENERKTRAGLQFLAWAKKWSPEFYATLVEVAGEAPKVGPLNQLGDSWGLGQAEDFIPGDPTFSTTAPASTSTGDGGWADRLFGFAKQAIPTYFAYRAQKDMTELNLERARHGQPPIDPGVVAPQVRVVHDLPPSVQQSIDDFKLGGMNILLWGALAVGGFFLLRTLR